MYFSLLKLERISNIVLYFEFSNLSKRAYMDKIAQRLISVNFPLKLLLSENAFGSVVGFIHAEKFILVSSQILFSPLLFSYFSTKPNMLKI